MLGITLTVLGLVLTIVGLILTIRARPRLSYKTHDETLISKPDQTPLGELDILFNGSPVQHVMTTMVALWNSGATTIRGGDVVETDPLLVTLGGGAKILGATTVRTTRKVNKFRIHVDKNNTSRAFITFDYLDRRDGATFMIVHTSPRGQARVQGSVRGVPRGAEYWGDLWNQPTFASPLTFLFGAAIGAIPSFWAVKTLHSELSRRVFAISLEVSGAIAIALLIFLIASGERAVWRKAPKLLW